MRRNNKVSVRLLSAFAAVLAFGTMARATLAPHAPSMSVHESRYGTVTNGDRKESVQRLEIRIVSHAEPGTTYQVQCFFLKRGKKDAPVTVDDTVIFNVVNPHGTYEVIAHPIKVAGTSSSKASGSSNPKSGKSSKKSHPVKTLTSESPREGYVVRILCEGVTLRTHFSGHSVENLLEQDPGWLEQAVLKKSVRHLEANELLKH